MQPRARVIKEVVEKSLYVVDEHAIADAIVLRAMTKLAIPERSGPAPRREQQIRSFRRNRDARSFRLCGAPAAARRP